MAGSVQVRVVKAEPLAISGALTAARAFGGANGKYGVTAIQNGQYTIVWGIKEA